MILFFILCFLFTVAKWNFLSSSYFYYTVETSQCLQGADSSGKKYIRHLTVVIHQYPKGGLWTFKNFVHVHFHAAEFQNVTYSAGIINNDAYRDWSIDKKLGSWVSTAHNTNIISICFIQWKGTIENKRKGSSIRVYQKYQLCISCIYISLRSPLTKLQLNKYNLHRRREESLVVTSSDSGTDKILPVCCITKRILRNYRVQELETSNEAVK